jgi:hypothetical protein
VPNPVGQMRRDLTHHEFSFDHGKQPDQRRQVPSATTARGQDVWCLCAHAGSLQVRLAALARRRLSNLHNGRRERVQLALFGTPKGTSRKLATSSIQHCVVRAKLSGVGSWRDKDLNPWLQFMAPREDRLRPEIDPLCLCLAQYARSSTDGAVT